MILLVDNYDSFVHNLARYFRLLGQPTRVVRSDRITLNEVRALAPSAIVISPGPRSPHEAGISVEIVSAFSGRVPILGVCLGHQAIGAAFGAQIVPVDPVHGRDSTIHHDGTGLFDGLASPMRVGRYHSLVVDPGSMPDCLRTTARTEEGIVMAIGHDSHPTYGVQFHPESVLTESGGPLIANFLRLAALEPRPIEPAAGGASPAEIEMHR